MPDALQLLREDHQKVKDLFKRFEDSDDTSEKQLICDETIVELVVHSTVEEEVFYPAVRAEIESEEDEEMMDEADEEHHVADLLIAELGSMRSTDAHFDAKYTVLAENVKHHIQEEESEILPKAAELGSARMAELGEKMAQRKMELMAELQSGSSNGRSANGRTPARRKTATARKTSTNGRKATGRKPTTAAKKTSAAGRKTTAARGGSGETRGRTTRTGARTGTGTARTTTRTTRTTARKTSSAGRKTATRARGAATATKRTAVRKTTATRRKPSTRSTRA